MKNVLILTYYWPPTGGAGVHRWLKFVKYLRRFGWEPIVYTPENPESPLLDPSLENDIPEGLTILKTRIWEPYALYKKFVGHSPGEGFQAGFLSEQEVPKGKQGFSVWIRGNFFIPDARKYWIKPSVKYLTAFLKKVPVKVVVTTGPPHSLHLIGLKLKQKLNIPWVADFRDPWTGIDFYPRLKLTRAADRKHHRLEQQVIRQADAVITVSHGMKKDFRKYCQNGIHVITNGYDPEDIPSVPVEPAGDFLITHLGSVNADRNPHAFWQAVSEITRENETFKKQLRIRLIGKTDVTVRTSIHEHGLKNTVELIPPVPHEQVFTLLQQSRLLLLPVNRTPNASSILTGKLFEYLATGRPILGIGPEDGEMARILEENEAGQMCHWDRPDRIKSFLEQLFEKYLAGQVPAGSVNTGKYSRVELTRKLAEILDQTVDLS
ncbi:MAG TPA: glycosyltransferase [Bacteroidetes bacterium]|nr:glycosyltransferase [Bacteroidota bacterium]